MAWEEGFVRCPRCSEMRSSHYRGICSVCWTVLREQILKRDNYRCRYCKVAGVPKKKLQIHHLKPITDDYKNNDSSNLVTLCDHHHARVHAKELGIYSYRVLLPDGITTDIIFYPTNRLREKIQEMKNNLMMKENFLHEIESLC